jgi:hypothetical protein
LRYQAGQETGREVVESDELGMAEALLAFTQQYPRSPFAPLALSQRAEVGKKLLDFNLTLDSYRRLVAEYPASEQAAEAGLTLAGMSLDEGKYEEALAAAKVGAEAAPWDRKPAALLSAAVAARQAGEVETARDYYQRARDEAEVVRRRAGARARGGNTRRSPAQIILECESISRQARQALSSSLAPEALLPQGRAAVVGQLRKDGVGMAGARLTLGAAGNFPSPHVAQATTGPDGSFTMTGLAPGSYQTFTLTLPGWYRTWGVAGLQLPLGITGPRTVLPPLALVRQTVTTTLLPPPPPGPSQPALSTAGRRGGRGSEGRGPGGGGGRGRGGGGGGGRIHEGRE